MAKAINAIPYYNQLQSFDGVITQRTNKKGGRMSGWVQDLLVVAGTETASTNFRVTCKRYMAMTDNVSAFLVKLIDVTNSVGQHIDLMYALIMVDGDGTKKTTIPMQNNISYIDYNSRQDPPEYSTTSVYAPVAETSRLDTIFKNLGIDADVASRYADIYGALVTSVFMGDIWSTQRAITASLNSTPLFDLTNDVGVKDYINNGDTSTAIVDYSIDWTVYVNEGLTPPVKIVWRSPLIERGIESGAIDADNVYVKIYASYGVTDTTISNQLYTTGYATTNFLTVAQINNPPLADSIISPNPLVGKRGTCTVKFAARVVNENTSVGYVILSNIVGEHGVSTYGFNTLIDSSTITIIEGTGDDDDGYVPPPEDSDINSGETDSTDGYIAARAISTPYAITTDDLKSLAYNLWTGDFNKTIFNLNSSPLENIISCKCVPTTFTGSSELIVIGNFNTNILGAAVNSIKKVTLGTIDITPQYNSFLDYAPYTKTMIYIPFIGFKELDTSMVMDKTVKVEYIIDVITASCKALIYASDIYVQSFDGQCGVDIPLSASNRAQVEASYISGAVGAIGELVTGDVGGAVDKTISAAMTPYHYNTQGVYNPACGSCETKLCYVIIDRPTAQYPTNYGHLYGYPCNLTLPLSTLSGYTICGADIDLSDCAATETEKQQIIDLLTSGVYL